MNDLEINYIRKVIKNKKEKLVEARSHLSPEDDDDAVNIIEFKMDALELADDAIYALRGKS